MANLLNKLKKSMQNQRQEYTLAMSFARATDAELKALGDSLPDGYIAGWASTPDLDTYHHVVVSGAFDAAIKARGLRGPKSIKLLVGHDWDKGAGEIKTLENRGGRLWIEAQLNLNISYARDCYEVMKMTGGWNFSVGFMLQDYEFKESAGGDEYLQINRGDLYEVSVVPFPGNEECTMEFIKSRLAPPTCTTMAEFEKHLVTTGVVGTRDSAHAITLAVKKHLHLFQKAQVESPAEQLEHPQEPPVTAAEKTKIADALKKLREVVGS